MVETWIASLSNDEHVPDPLEERDLLNCKQGFTPPRHLSDGAGRGNLYLFWQARCSPFKGQSAYVNLEQVG